MRSMTGFGRGEASGPQEIWVVECSSVNRRQLEVVVGLPRDLAELEAVLRNRVAAVISRGRVNVTVQLDATRSAAASLQVDEELAQQYLEALQRLSGRLGFDFAPSAMEVTRWPGVFHLTQTATQPTDAAPLIEQALDLALQRMIAMREAEGAALAGELRNRLGLIQQLLTSISGLAAQVPGNYRKALHQRLKEAGLDVPLEDERLLREMAIFADRSDISEEIARAQSHLAQFGVYLESTEPAGRSLDFLIQELFREFNTIASKANLAPISHHVVTAKTEMERIREQVQNIE